VSSGVSVHADNERMSVRNNSVHSVRVPFLEMGDDPAADDRRRSGEESLRGIPVMSHDPYGSGMLLIKPLRWAGKAPVTHRGRTVHRQGTTDGPVLS